MSDFKFKKFTVRQEKSEAKVGTDGVLLGCWANVKNEPLNILDVGAGTGLVSLILAQRAIKSNITALEIEPYAAQECNYNFVNSPWNERLQLVNVNFFDFTPVHPFDLIISNPPFYLEKTPSPNSKRNLARHAENLPLKKLFSFSKKHLSCKGSLQLILPFSQKIEALETAYSNALFLKRITNVKGREGAPYKRVLLEFTFNSTLEISENNLILEIDRHQYTKDFKTLVKDFYLNL